MFGQAGVEFFHKLGLVFSGVAAFKETIQGFIEESFPRDFFFAWVDREEERTVGLRCFKISGSVTDHQNLCRCVFALGCKLEVLGLGSHLLARDHLHKPIEMVLGPLTLEGVCRSLGDAHGICVLRELDQCFADERERRHAVYNVLHGVIHSVAPHFDVRQSLIALGDFGIECGIAELRFALHPFFDSREVGHLYATSLHLRACVQQMDRFRKCREAIRASILGIQVHKLPDFARVFADGLEVEGLDEHRSETFLMFDLHAVEDAAIGVDANEEFTGGLEIAQCLGWVTHGGSVGRNSCSRLMFQRSRECSGRPPSRQGLWGVEVKFWFKLVTFDFGLGMGGIVRFLQASSSELRGILAAECHFEICGDVACSYPFFDSL